MADARCQVWHAELTLRHASHEALLDELERTRAGAFARPEDRSRFVVGAALLKLAVADATGLSPQEVVVDRTCDQCGEPHGRPRIPGTDVHVSVAHSGSLVAVALTRAGPVGIDVEQRTGQWTSSLNRRVLAAAERAETQAQFLTYWCRKESVVKATGEGLRVPLTDVVVSAPGSPPALMSYRGGSMPAAMFDLRLDGPDYAGALTVLTDQPVRLEVAQSGALL
ncbi:MAG TPA: 4'-phosphopantetheinyl transferase superfamily protein [Frankiaceae bacterium]|nr:4'-phosphopantetheinyl transferase superfamily protein [Frankiaceae bacterium]